MQKCLNKPKFLKEFQKGTNACDKMVAMAKTVREQSAVCGGHLEIAWEGRRDRTLFDLFNSRWYGLRRVLTLTVLTISIEE